MPDLERELAVATSLALEAAAILSRHRASGLQVEYKERGEVVTAADREADALIRGRLLAAFPGDAIYSEETADSPERLSATRVWIIDPIDATSDYASGGSEHCTSIGLAVGGQPVLGVIYNPAREELFAGVVGQGVTLNGKRVSSSSVAILGHAHLEVSRKEWRRGLDRAAAGLPVYPVASMAYKLARIAAGVSDGAFSFKRRGEWGGCAGTALVLAAGGCVTHGDGSPVRFNRPNGTRPVGLVAAGTALHRSLLDAVAAIAATSPDGGCPAARRD